MIPITAEPKVVEKKESYAKFEIDSLYPGYGITLGNALRRVLLSSLEGAAITEVNIKGASHEFSTIDGVLEDTVTIILNLKQLRFRLLTDEPQTATLKVKGEKEVKGKDFDLPSQVELVNKEAHIATLTKKGAEFELEIKVEKGTGYRGVETSKKGERLEIGTIKIDAIFTPIKRVSFNVENMRVGERTDFDRLFIEVETDGTITPEQAMHGASDTLVKHFSLIADTFKLEEIKEVKEEKNEKKKKGKKV